MTDVMTLKLINKRDGHANDHQKKLTMLHTLEMTGYAFLIKGHNFHKIIISKLLVIMHT